MVYNRIGSDHGVISNFNLAKKLYPGTYPNIAANRRNGTFLNILTNINSLMNIAPFTNPSLGINDN